MMATTVPVHGLGEAYKRKEDARFIRGQGTYVDDVQLPGMLYGDIVRSPYAHALITNIDTSAALKVPGVLAVITGTGLDADALCRYRSGAGSRSRAFPDAGGRLRRRHQSLCCCRWRSRC